MQMYSLLINFLIKRKRSYDLRFYFEIHIRLQSLKPFGSALWILLTRCSVHRYEHPVI